MSTSRTLIFSDTHLSPRPDQRKADFLLRIVESSDQVILNGDFWEGQLSGFEEFAQASCWQPLFAALKARQAVYLYGNHDPASKVPAVTPFSACQAAFHEFTQAGQRFHMEHGNRIEPESDEKYPGLPHPLLVAGTLADNLLTRIGGRHFLKIYRHHNAHMKAWETEHMEPDVFLICGHSHWAEVCENPRFANSGSIRGGLGSYLIIEGGKPELHIERY